MDSITTTRAELYERVWTTPMVRLAKEYGLSGTGLAKVCRRHRVPRPPQGYWAKKQHGKSVPQPRLPKVDDPDLETITIRPVPKSGPGSGGATPPDIPVADTLDEALPLVRRTARSLRGARKSDTGVVSPRAQKALAVTVGPESIDRALRIMDALLREFEARSWPVRIEMDERLGRCTVVAVNGEDVAWRLVEKLDRTPLPISEYDRRRQEQYSWYTRCGRSTATLRTAS